MKIAIIGYSGSGKSSLAKYLEEKYYINTLNLDKVQWLPNWQLRNNDEKKEILSSFMKENISWVIEGNYFNLFFDERMQQADKIVIMRFNRFTCLWRCFKRYLKYKGKTRPDITDGCNEKFDLEFIKWILFESRNKERRKTYRKVMREYSEKTILIYNQAQLYMLRDLI